MMKTDGSMAALTLTTMLPKTRRAPSMTPILLPTFQIPSPVMMMMLSWLVAAFAKEAPSYSMTGSLT